MIKDVNEKIAYLHGLLDGQNIQDEAQKKVYQAILAALDAISDTLEYQDDSLDDLEETVLDLCDEMDDLSEDIEDFLDEWEEDWEDEDEEDFDFIEVKCPECGDTIFFDQDMMVDNQEFVCPSCQTQIFPALTDND
ncbi:hypothetical protein LJC07_05355 [Christensenellaceae bacterium OttesenSCG-928-L17]|nr:hypothetical protein [Christensenellaceae bacterium OttesenSCG-928-L17]